MCIGSDYSLKCPGCAVIDDTSPAYTLSSAGLTSELCSDAERRDKDLLLFIPLIEFVVQMVLCCLGVDNLGTRAP